jgi:hypothetical protein
VVCVPVSTYKFLEEEDLYSEMKRFSPDDILERISSMLGFEEEF